MFLILLRLSILWIAFFGVPPFMNFVRPPLGSTLLTRCDAGVVHVLILRALHLFYTKKIIPKLKAGERGFRGVNKF
jgi:hypothetical protein